MKLDILAIGVHPDDVELGCSGTIAKHIAMGKKVGVLDLTRGELGTRGNADIRLKEANNAAKILGISVRENLGLRDAFFENSDENQLLVIEVLRKYQPDIVLANAISDRHPDHGRAAELVRMACYYSGLSKITTTNSGENQKNWRPKALYHYIQDRYLKPDFVIDVTDYFEIKSRAIMAFTSQFYNPASPEPETPISSKEFLEFVEARMINFGRELGYKYAEGFTAERQVGVDSLFDLK